VGWGHKSYVIDASGKYACNFLKHFFKSHLLDTVVQGITTNLMILAINALQVTIGKKDIADALVAGNSRFLSPVYTYRRNTE
jgi:hypothetical protein